MRIRDEDNAEAQPKNLILVRTSAVVDLGLPGALV
jgi:hypothetical protein